MTGRYTPGTLPPHSHVAPMPPTNNLNERLVARSCELKRQNQQLLELVAEAYDLLQRYEGPTLARQWGEERRAWMKKVNPEGQ